MRLFVGGRFSLDITCGLAFVGIVFLATLSLKYGRAPDLCPVVEGR